MNTIGNEFSSGLVSVGMPSAGNIVRDSTMEIAHGHTIRLLLTLSLLLIGASAVAQGAGTWQPIQPRQGGGAVLTRPGLHCVTRDMLVDSHYRPFAHGSEYKNDDHALILVAGNDVVVDLQRHTVVANAAMRAAIDTPARDWINYPDVHGPVLPANLTIRNGKIRVTKRVGDGWGIKIFSAPDLPLDLRSDIASPGAAAHMAPIRLHHGDGAIIRNNRIVVKGDGHPWAVTSFRTGAITLEGNTLNGKPVGHEGIKVFADDFFQLTETTGVL